jgi:hypothetical protein
MSPDQGKFENGQAFLKDTELDSALKALYQYTEAVARHSIDWYWRKKSWKARMSWMLRLVVIILFTLGGLVPIIKATLPDLVRTDTFDFGQAGYLLIAVAAGCLGLDRFFGYSSGWIRYVTTAMAIEKSLEEYRMEWAMLTSRLQGQPAGGDLVEQLIQLSKHFLVSVRSQVEEETKLWAMEFQTTLVQLERDIKTRAETAREEARAQAQEARAGAISLTVSNGQDTDQGFTVFIDDKEVEQKVLGQKCEILPVPPGMHKLRVTASIGGVPAVGSELVTVETGAVLKITIQLARAKSAAAQ